MLASAPYLGHSSILSSFSPLLQLKIGFVGECNQPWGKQLSTQEKISDLV